MNTTHIRGGFTSTNFRMPTNYSANALQDNLYHYMDAGFNFRLYAKNKFARNLNIYCEICFIDFS